MKPKILVTRTLPPDVMTVLETDFDVECNPHDRVLHREELLSSVKGKNGLLPLLTDRIDDEVMDIAGGDLKIIANYAVGYNNIDVDAATKRKILVSNTPGVLTDTTADLAMGLILAVARRIAEGDAYTRSGKFIGWGPMLLLGTDVHHKTLGIAGFGRIGFAVAKRAAGFGMRILYTARRRGDPELENHVGARYVDKDTLLKESDFLSIHVPATQDTHHFLGAREFSLMKRTAFVINTARGEVIDEKALVEALESGEIAGAGLDVFEWEPHVSPELTRMPNVVLLPHIGSASMETRTRMGLMAAENLAAVLLGKRRPPHCVNPEALGAFDE